MRAASMFFHRRLAIGKIGLWAASYFFALAALAGESQIIAYSNRSDATVQNNGRRMVRTSDDRRIVVYQDSLADRPVIVCVRSNDGRTWSPPAIVANGTFPALAISNENWLYLVWALEDRRGIGLAYSTDGAMSWERSIQIRPEATVASQFPAVEATTQAVHVVWQQKSLSGSTEKICYQRFAKDLSKTLTPILTPSAEDFDSRLPVIAGDLEFKTDFLHLVWSEYPTPNGSPRLVYCNFMESAGPPGWSFMAPAVVPKASGKIHPSISVRNFDFNKNPNVCYKTFRRDSIDTVWTEGDRAP